MDLKPITEQCLAVISGHITDSLGRTKRSCAVVVDPAIESLLLNATLNLDNAEISNTTSSAVFFAKAGATRQFTLSRQELDWKDDGPVVFVLRPSPKTCRLMAEQMTTMIRSRAKPDFRAIFIPRRSFRCEQVLKETGVFNWFNQGLHAVSLGFVSLDDDLVSMEMDEFLKETKVEGDGGSYAYAARALMDLGDIRSIRCKGTGSAEVANLYIRMLRELNESAVILSSSTSNNNGNVEDGEIDGMDGVDDSGSMHSSLSSKRTDLDAFLTHELEDDEEDEMFRLTTKAGGPLDVVGGTPRPRRSPQKQRAAYTVVDTLIILDREVDMVSPLSTPLTYESLLDEQFEGMKAGFLTVKSSILRIDENASSEDAEVSGSVSGSPLVTISVKNDPLFKEIRDVGFGSIMSILNDRARRLKDEQDRMHRTRDIEDLQGFIQRLPELQQVKKRLTTHIALGRRVQALTADRKFRMAWQAERAAIKGDASLLEQRSRDAAARGDSLVKVLRQLCLACVLGGGYSQRDLDAIRQEIVHTYGYDTIFTLDNLEKLGMLAERPFHPQHKLSASVPGVGLSASAALGPKNDVCIFSNFSLVRDKLELLVEDDSKDYSYVFAGYRPISVRLVELEMAPGGWAGRQDVMRALSPSAPVSFPDVPGLKTARTSGSHARGNQPDNEKKKTMVVFFLGGVSLAEIAAIRYLASRPESQYRIVIATTAVVNGNNIIQSLCHITSGESSSSSSAGSALNPFG